MDLGRPISSVVPSVHGVVLSVLARTEQPLTGRTVAELAGGQASRSQVNQVLRGLTEAGIVHSRRYGSANLYTLNRDHLAAPPILALACLRNELVDRMRAAIAVWSPPPQSALLFGSAARGDGDVDSDIDVFVVRPDSVEAQDEHWDTQVRTFADQVQRWTGNYCAVAEFSESECQEMVESEARLTFEVGRDGIHLGGASFPPMWASRAVS